MSRLPLILLFAGIVACQKSTPLAPPTPEALGAELATFPQVLVPLTPQALDELNKAIARVGAENVTSVSFPQSYMHGKATVTDKEINVFVAYSGTWQAPKEMILQPMSVLQFLRAFEADIQTDLAILSSPKGSIFLTRAQLPQIIAATQVAGAGPGDLPFNVVRGAGR